MSEISRPVMRYHGGKWRLAPWLISHFPKHRVYVEPFGGAASILLRKKRAYSEVYNDRWGDIVAMFKVLRDPVQSSELERRIRLTPFAREEYEAVTPESFEACDDQIERARMLIFRSFAGFGSNAAYLPRNTGFRSNSNRSHTTPAHDWANYPDVLAAITERLAGVVIENRDALEVMQQHDAPDVLHYVDPPYVHATRALANPYDLKYGGYVHEMSDDDHRVLAAGLADLEGMVLVSGYPSPLYEDLFAGWAYVDSKALADGALARTERLWFNAAAAATGIDAHQISMFDAVPA
jgi:DNA adenine methylase